MADQPPLTPTPPSDVRVALAKLLAGTPWALVLLAALYAAYELLKPVANAISQVLIKCVGPAVCVLLLIGCPAIDQRTTPEQRCLADRAALEFELARLETAESETHKAVIRAAIGAIKERMAQNGCAPV